MKATKSTNQGFSASLAQCKRAYEAHFGQPMPTGMTYQAAAQAVVDALGPDAGREFVLAQTNDPKVPYQSDDAAFRQSPPQADAQRHTWRS